MFGSISHVRIKPGHEADMEALEKEWMATIRPTIPGEILWLKGRPKERPEETIDIFLCRDAETYYKLADAPEMDALYQKMREHYEGDPTWEDVHIDVVDRG